MSKLAVITIAHGNFAMELLKSVEMIMGEQEDAVALGLNPGEDVEALRDHAEELLLSFRRERKEVLVLVDLLGGSPSNVGLYLVKKHHVPLITGMNMMMLIELFSIRDSENIDTLVEKIVAAGVEGIQSFGGNHKEG